MNQNSGQIYQKLRENARFHVIFGDRLYRRVADNYRPINRSFFRRLIGRLIGIGRTLEIALAKTL